MEIRTIVRNVILVEILFLFVVMRNNIIPETQVPCLPPLLPRTPMCDGDNNVLTYTASSPSLSPSSASSEGEKDISQTLLSPMQQRDESDGDDLSLSESIVDSTFYVTDAEASKYDFLQRLKHYMNNNKITMQNWQSVEIAIMIEAGTIIRNGKPLRKTIVQTNSMMCTFVQLTRLTRMSLKT